MRIGPRQGVTAIEASQAAKAVSLMISDELPCYKLTGRLDKGWSSDTKYLLEGPDGKSCLLRKSPSVSIERRNEVFSMMGLALSLGISAPEPMKVGTFKDGSTFLLQSWLEGEALEDLLPALNISEQYRKGIAAGTLLKVLHGAPPGANSGDAGVHMLRKLARHLKSYSASGLNVPGAVGALRYIDRNLGLLYGRPSKPQHGDFHPGNMLLCPDGGLGIIDFDRCDYGDPYEEFYKVQFFAVPLSHHFANGQIHAYFDGEPPERFWRVLGIYVAHAAVYSPVWALPFGEVEVKGMLSRSASTMEDYHGFESIVPAWYEGGGRYAGI